MRILLHAGLSAFFGLLLIAGPSSTAAIASEHSTQRIAQAATTGRLTGTVQDPSNAAVSGASVSVTGNGQNLHAATNNIGYFEFNVPPGLYDVVITKGGFQTNETDSVGVIAGSTTNLSIFLTAATLSTLREIGRVTSRATNSINNRPVAVTTVGQDDIYSRALPNLEEIAQELPGVTITRSTGTDPNAEFRIRGMDVETRTMIDGHPLSSGVFGDYNTAYDNAALFQQVEVVKGVGGLSGPNAGESPVGTINLRTRDFTRNDQAYVALGNDTFGGSYYNLWASGNLMKDSRLSYVVAKSQSNYNGTAKGYYSNIIGLSSPNANYTLNDAGTATALVKWQYDMGYPYVLNGELAKLRYKFSETTSLGVQFLGLEGKFTAQGGAYASYSGNRVIAPCYLQTAPAAPGATGIYTSTGTYASNTNPAACNIFSEFNPPYASGLIGQNVPMYGWFPNSVVQNNEPYWSAEFRTGLKNDTILIRPYAAEINRFISGANENQLPGNGGGWWVVTSNANCQTQFVPPNATTGAGAKGPCFPYYTTFNQTAPYVNAVGGVNPVFPTTATPYYTCSLASPCYTTFTEPENDGLWGYGTPFSQPEVDRLRGITFQYLHPVGNNLYGFSYDWNRDDTSKLTSDTTIVPAGCTPTVAGNQTIANVPAAPGYQPTCPLPFLPGNDINIPSTQIQHGDFALTGLFQLNPQLQMALGGYLTTWNANLQIENPALVIALGSQAPVSFVKQSRSFSHVDPQLGLTWRPSPNLAFRGSAGSGVTVPYAGQISGLANLTAANPANNFTFTYSTPNAALQPETTIAYGLGSDVRLADGGVFSLDLFDNTTHNVFVSSTVPGTTATVPGCLPTYNQCQTSTTFNGPIWRNYGVELTFNKSLPVGFGYLFTTSLQRSFYDQLPAFIYNAGSNLINGAQIPGEVPFAKAYGELRYGFAQGQGRISVGADWEGQNNAYYTPGFVMYNATVRVPIPGVYTVQLAIDNLTNYNTGTFIGAGTLNNGVATPRLTNIGGTLVYTSNTTSVKALPPRNFRIELSKQMGTP